MWILILISALLLLQTNAKFHEKNGVELRRMSKDFIKEELIRHIKNDSGTDLCTLKLRTIVNNLSSGDPLTFFHSFEVFDAWGGIPSGVTYGHLMDMGNYQQCIHINFTTFSKIIHEEINVEGRYCQVRSQIRWTYPTVSEIGIGICIPKECNEQKVTEILSTALNGTQIDVFNCSMNDELNLTVIDYMGLAVFGIVVFSVILSTSYDLVTQKLNRPRKSWCLAFSAIRNSKNLFAANQMSEKNSIKCLDGIRSLSMIWVIYGHSAALFVFFPILNKRMILSWYQTVPALLVVASSFAVETFFFISGLLLTTIGLTDISKNNGKINVIRMYTHRLFRVLPMLVINILIIMTILRFCGSGPTWSAYLKIQKSLCDQNWWKTLLFIQNYDGENMCLIPSWYLAVDMQLYLISPFILFGLYKWGVRFLPALVVAAGLSIECVYSLFYKNGYTELVSAIDPNSRTRQAIHYYVTHTRYTIWLMGITFGYIFTKIKNNVVRIPIIINIFAWAATFAIMLFVVFEIYHTHQPGHEPTVFEAATYDAFSKVAWGLALSWIIFACHYGYGGLVNDFLSHRIWQITSRLCFSMFLTSSTVQVIIFGNCQTSQYFSSLEVITKFWLSLGFTAIVSIVLVLFCEAPIIALGKMLFQKKIRVD